MADNIKADLESKRRKLNRIREERLRRTAASASSAPSMSIDSCSLPTTNAHSSTINSVSDIDEILKSLGIDGVSAKSSSLTTDSTAPFKPESYDSVELNENVDESGNEISKLSLGTKIKKQCSKDRRKLKAIFNAFQIDIPPNPETQCYTKETQTVMSDHETSEALQWDDEVMFTTRSDIVATLESAAKSATGLNQFSNGRDSCAVDVVHDEAAATAELLLTAGRGRPPNADEREQLMNSNHFTDFINKSGRALERMLASGTTNNITEASRSGTFINYRSCMGDRRFSDDQEDTGFESDDECNKLLRPVHVIHQPGYDEFKGISINSVDWCPSRPELLLAAYGDVNEDVGGRNRSHDSQVLIWNQRHGGMKCPEFTLTCYQSPVTCAIFSPYHRHLVYGGTYSGQIVIWDLRTSKPSPVQRSMPSGAAHQHPVYALRTLGNSENAYSLISVSSDGKMCTWRPDMVSKPSQDAISLLYKQTMGVATTCLDFPTSAGGDVNKFVVGSDEYNVYTGLRHGSSEKSAGISGVLEGHKAQITAISCHPHLEWSDLLLSSSLDSNVSLWSMREMSHIANLNSDSNEYMLDVKWSRYNPAVLACSTGGGRVCIWDLSRNTELPRATQYVQHPAKRLAWQYSSAHSGAGVNGRTHLAVGTEAGTLHLFSVSEHLSQPQSDTVSRFNMALKDLRSRNCRIER